MERALNRDALELALGENERLPSAPELQRLLAEAEIGLFAAQPRLDDQLLRVAWFLHGVASSPRAFQVYTAARQRQAFQVSAHIFDLALSERWRARSDRLRLAFAAAIGYRRGGLDPNAMAVYRRVADLADPDVPILDHIETVALEAGVLFLSFETRTMTTTFGRFLRSFAELAREVGIADLRPTIFGPALLVTQGADQLRRFLLRGAQRRLEEARESLSRAAAPAGEVNDIDARWVAAHLLTLVDDTSGSSVWTGLPEDVPPAVRNALVVTTPAVLTLWSPQRELFADDERNPLAPATRRVVLSIPTSAGKTLLAQLFALVHLADGIGNVCYVAPMRSLGREVRSALRARLRAFRGNLGAELPDYFLDLGLEPSDLTQTIDVMTPERLSNLVRNDLAGVLERYGLFVFDEAHLIGDPSRGFTMESLLALLHWRTLESHHRIILLSAALGNRAEIKSWLDPADEGRLYASDWRAPRRLHAVYHTDIDWDSPATEPHQAAGWRERRRFPVHGLIAIRPTADASTRRLELDERVGDAVFRVDEEGRRERHRYAAQSTPQYRMNAKIVAAIGHGGPVLVICSTRPMARLTAAAIADETPLVAGTRDLRDFIATRLGSAHPLTTLIPHGVAYHHGGLPVDVLDALEEALREERLRYLAATTTLTEGVNLPVRTVVLAETHYEGQDPNMRLLGPRLLNAMGRAGRATKESEGWVVWCLPRRPSSADFDAFNPLEAELEVKSRLTADEALEALATFEETQRAAEDAAFEHYGREVDDFITFVWLVFAALEELGDAPEAADIDAALTTTLGFQQLPDSVKARWRDVANAVRVSYTASDPEARQRWPKTGSSIPSARALDALAGELTPIAARRLANDEDTTDPDVALSILDSVNTFERLLELSESPRPWGFRTAANQPRTIQPEPSALVAAWVGGDEMDELADTFLGAVGNREFALEQMADTISEQFEHFFAWTLGFLVGDVNRRLEASGADPVFAIDLPLYVRYGVDRRLAVTLLTAGLRSRTFALAVAASADASGIPADELPAWLGEMPIEEWRRRFGGRPGDLLDLVDYTGSRTGGLLADLLSEGEVTVHLADPRSRAEDGEVEIRDVATDPQPRRLGLYRADDLIAVVHPSALADVAAIVASGLEIQSELRGRALLVTLREEAAA